MIRNFCMFGRAVALGAIVLCGLALASAALPAEAALDHGLQTRTALPSASPLLGHSVSDWRLIHPTAITSGGGYIWVTSGNSVIQLSASTGALVRVIQGPSYRFNAPWGITSGGGYIWVTNMMGNSVTVLSASTGRLVTVINDPSYEFRAGCHYRGWQ